MLRVGFRTSREFPSCWLICVCLCKINGPQEGLHELLAGVSPWCLRWKGHNRISHSSHPVGLSDTLMSKPKTTRTHLHVAGTCDVPQGTWWYLEDPPEDLSAFGLEGLVQLLGHQCTQHTQKSLVLFPAYLPGSWKAGHVTASQAFPLSPTTLSNNLTHWENSKNHRII